MHKYILSAVYTYMSCTIYSHTHGKAGIYLFAESLQYICVCVSVRIVIIMEYTAVFYYTDVRGPVRLPRSCARRTAFGDSAGVGA